MAVKTEHTEVKYAEFTDCVLLGVNWALLLPDGWFASPISRLTNCKLKYNHFMNISFKKFDFSGSDLPGSIFADCSLAECSFNGCDLNGTEFYKCDLRKSDFRRATGYQVDILSCKLKGARFSMIEAVNLLRALEIKLE